MDKTKNATLFTGVGGVIGAVGTKVGLMTAGFSSIGPVSGSIAAGMQSTVGNVVAGSFFSSCQATAMGGVTALSTPCLIGAGVGLAGYGSYIGIKKIIEKKKKTQWKEKIDYQ